MENNFKYIVYQTINIVNNKIYIGVHKTNPDVFDGYIGNGVNINWPSSYMNPKWPFQYAVKKYGTKNFKRSILFIFDNEEDAYKKEAELVTLEFVSRKDTYNLVRGGHLRPNYYKRSNIYQFDIKGNLVKKWEDIYEVSKFLETWKESIYGAINSKRRLFGSYWAYSENINIKEYSSPNLSQKVYRYNTDGKCTGIYESIQKAAKINNYKACELFNRIKEGALTKGNYYSLELYDEYIPKPRLILKNNTIHVYSINGEYEQSVKINDLYEILDCHSNRKIIAAIKAKTPINNKLITIEKVDKLTPYIQKNKKKEVLVYTKYGEFVKEFPSINAACKELNLDSSTVNKVLKGVGKSTKGYVIKYKN